MNGPEDFMELGDSGWIPMPDGTYVNIKEGTLRDVDGNIYSLNGTETDDLLKGDS